MEPAHCPEFPRRPDSRAERHLGKCISALAPGVSASRGTASGRSRSLITPQLCMLSHQDRSGLQVECRKSIVECKIIGAIMSTGCVQQSTGTLQCLQVECSEQLIDNKR